MGRTKALIEIDGVPMAALVAQALRDAGCVSVLAYGGDPVELAPLDLVVLPDAHPGAGPLGAVVGLLEHFAAGSTPGTDVFVVACDLPSLSGPVLAPLVEAADRHADADVVVARTSTIESACAIWRASALEPARRIFDGGERALHRAIAVLTSVDVEVPEAALRNINTPGELDRYP
jgi:molybdopterin-guanine dinucleotide biosynthesis protein A